MNGPITDLPLQYASTVIADALANPTKRPIVKSFFDDQTYTISHVVRDPQSNACAIIDSVLDYDAASGRTTNASATELLDYIKSENLDEDVVEPHRRGSAAKQVKMGREQTPCFARVDRARSGSRGHVTGGGRGALAASP